jgi:ribosomal protein S7
MTEKGIGIGSRLRAVTPQQVSADGTRLLKQLLDSNESKVAWDLFHKMVENNAVNEFHFSVMMKACDTSNEIREWINKMLDDDDDINIRPNLFTYTTLVSQLMIEGKADDAQHIVEVEMPAAEVEADNKVKNLLRTDDDIWLRKRTSLLRKFLESKNTQSAWIFFNTMMENNAANEIHANVMMMACNTSVQKLELMEKMKAASLVPNIATYTLLVRQLLMEGKWNEACHVLKVEMPAAGVKSNDKMLQTFERPVDAWSSMRTGLITEYLKDQDTDSAWNFFQILMENGAADEYQVNAMWQSCRFSHQIRDLMDEAIKLDFQIPVFEFNRLVKTLMLEGKVEEARDVVNIEMLDYGVKPNERSFDYLSRDSERWFIMRSQMLTNYLNSSDFETAWDFFNMLLENEAASVHQFSIMMRALDSSEKQREWMNKMEKMKVLPNAQTYEFLLKTLMVEGKTEEALHVVNSEMPAAGL